MLAKEVAPRVKAVFKEPLKAVGFKKSKGNTVFYRHGKDKIDLVQVEFMNKIFEGRFDATNLSFFLRLGVFFPGAELPPWSDGIRELQPLEISCHLRGGLNPKPSIGRAAEEPFWFVFRDASNLDAALHEALQSTISDGIAWLDKFPDAETTLELLYDYKLPMSPDGYPVFLGTKHSFVWAEVCSGLACVIGDYRRAASIYEEILPAHADKGSDCVRTITARVLAFHAWADHLAKS